MIAKGALVTVDLRNTDEHKLQEAEATMLRFIEKICIEEAVTFECRTLVRFEPVNFDPEMVSMVARTATNRGYKVKQMPSGAGHDAQMFASNCPTAMIFVPSVGGISHNAEEYTEPKHLHAGADVLLHVLLKKSL